MVNLVETNSIVIAKWQYSIELLKYVAFGVHYPADVFYLDFWQRSYECKEQSQQNAIFHSATTVADVRWNVIVVLPSQEFKKTKYFHNRKKIQPLLWTIFD